MAKLPNGWLQLVRSLCREWFPIEYPQSWYEDITSSERFFALAAVYKSQIIGLIVAEIKPYLKLNAEDRGILSRWFASKDTLVAYILSLGRCKDGFTYVYYVNGGHAPWGIYDYVKYVARAAWRGGGLYPWLWGKLRTALTIAWHR
ncbi:hypothetical protein MSG28_005123 [Choristoneura fumiferana]|nr:hypothetical protein MSG28_005123 [Choristoneura fumiferana]